MADQPTTATTTGAQSGDGKPFDAAERILRDRARAGGGGSRATAAPKVTPTPRPPARGPAINIEEGMIELHVTFGMIALMRKDMELAVLLLGEDRIQQIFAQAEEGGPRPVVADQAGKALANLASKNRAVHDGLTKVLTTSAWTEVANAYVPLIMLFWRRKPEKIGWVKKFILKRRMVKANGQKPPVNEGAKVGVPPAG